MSKFSWIPIYREIAEKLLGFRNKQDELIEIIKDLDEKGWKPVSTEDEAENGEPIELEEIDPFTFFASFNRGNAEKEKTKINRIEIIRNLKDHWSLTNDVPDDFDGIPVVNNLGSRFFAKGKDRKKEDIPLLWRLFKEALNSKIAEDTFTSALDINMVALSKITMGLFWIRPNQYLNMDAVNRKFLKEEHEISANEITDYKSYTETLKQVEEQIGERKFYELSHEAWEKNMKENQKSKKKPLGAEADVNDGKPSSKDATPEKFPLNQILYGPPGTGKTYEIQQEYMPHFTDKTNLKTKQEYLAEVVEDLSWFTSIVLAMMDNEEMKVPEIKSSNTIQIKSKITNKSTDAIGSILWHRLQTHTKEDCPDVNYTKRSGPYVFWKDKNSIWKVDKDIVEQELPEVYETWQKLKSFKPFKAEEKRYEFVTFHQSFSYEDFIEGIKPKIGNSSTSENNIQYEIKPGIFKRISEKAEDNPDKNYALFIDEINRGNVASIFGELITLIEKDKRGKLSVKLPYSQEVFTVPKNLYIIGTMNTADKSIEALDAALRRRFSFKEFSPKPDLLESINGIDLKQLLEAINKRIEVLLDKDHLIGHSYFLKIKNFEDLRSTFEEEIIPLLEEYFFNDRSKIKMILGPAFVKEEKIEIKKDAKSLFFKIDNDENEDDYENYTYTITIPKDSEDYKSIYDEKDSSKTPD